jgi:hypothetical protein
MKYEVTLTKIYNGRLEVEASSEEEAIEIAKENKDKADFEHGETTVDYAEII